MDDFELNLPPIPARDVSKSKDPNPEFQQALYSETVTFPPQSDNLTLLRLSNVVVRRILAHVGVSANPRYMKNMDEKSSIPPFVWKCTDGKNNYVIIASPTNTPTTFHFQIEKF